MKMLPILLVLLLLFSCKKEGSDSGPSSAEGMVIDATTQQPVPFANVALARQPADILTSVGYSQIQSVQAGADGRFSLSFDAAKDYNYSLFGLAPRYLYPVEPVSLERGKKNRVNVPIRPEGYLRIKINNSAAAPTKQISVNEFIPNQPTQFQGGGANAYLLITVRGNETKQLNWWVYEGPLSNSFSATIFCSAQDTTHFTINY